MIVRALPLLLVACADLPAGWAGAERVADFTQGPCDGDPYDAPPTEVTATLADGGVDVVAEPMGFRCSQEVEGFWKDDGDGVALLVQPVDMLPASVAKCDCAYRIEASIPDVDATTVTVWRRGDRKSGSTTPVTVGEADVAR